MAPYLMNHYLKKYLIKIWCILFYRRHHTLMLKLVFNKIDMYLTSLWRHERYLFSVFRWIFPAIFRRFSKKLSTSVVMHQTIFYQIIKINKTQLLLKYFFGARGVKGLGAIRTKIGPTSDVDKIFSKMLSQYVLFRNHYS
jgi:hypothetical protein